MRMVIWLHCGNQVTEEGEVQILEAIMTDEQISFWESNLKNLSENANVDTKRCLLRMFI